MQYRLSAVHTIATAPAVPALPRLGLMLKTAIAASCLSLFSHAALAQDGAAASPAAAPATSTTSAAKPAKAKSGDLGAVKAAIEARLNGPVDQVSRTPLPGIYEVVAGEEVFYIDEKAEYAFTRLVDMRTRESLTDKRVQALVEAHTPKMAFADLPLDDAIKIVKGDGARRVAIFEDPNCGYCKALEKTLLDLNNVTLYVFLYPVLGPDSVEKSKSIWCAADRQKTWQDWMQTAIAVPAAANGGAACKPTIDKNLALGAKLRVTGTPTLMFSSGKRVPGAIPLNTISQLLSDNG